MAFRATRKRGSEKPEEHVEMRNDLRALNSEPIPPSVSVLQSPAGKCS
jgi:hypothetical protein